MAITEGKCLVALVGIQLHPDDNAVATRAPGATGQRHRVGLITLCKLRAVLGHETRT